MPRIDETAGPEGGREIRLEGPTLWLVFALLSVALVLAFLAGRLTAPAAVGEVGLAGTKGGTSAESAPAEIPVEETLSFFDRAEGGGQVAEPRREAAERTPAGRAAVPASPPSPSGGWFVQVFAGRDRQAAELVARQLRGRNHPVRLDAEREGSGSLYKVRVGGYANREEAERVAEILRREGSSGAWVTPLPR
jgi:cell division septation protein DedD